MSRRDSASTCSVRRTRRPQTRLETSCTRTGRPRRHLRLNQAKGRRAKAEPQGQHVRLRGVTQRHSTYEPFELGRFADQNRKRRGDDKPETFDFLGFTHISGKNRLGLFTVRRKTIRKRMRAKLREIKQQLRERMHDPVRQTGQWLKSIMQGHLNYYTVPGNIDRLSVFRDRLTGYWWHTLRRRSEKRRISWTRMLALADRWLPRPRVLHPYPADRFAASHPRSSLCRLFAFSQVNERYFIN